MRGGFSAVTQHSGALICWSRNVKPFRYKTAVGQPDNFEPPPTTQRPFLYIAPLIDMIRPTIPLPCSQVVPAPWSGAFVRKAERVEVVAACAVGS